MVADEPRVARWGQEARNRWADMLNPVGVSETGCLIARDAELGNHWAEFGAGHPEYPREFIEEMKRV